LNSVNIGKLCYQLENKMHERRNMNG
jgi:hypothetical protein